MFIGVTFKFSQPFCDCKVLNYGYGLSSMGGVPAFPFQCRNCAVTVMMPLEKLSGGFEFNYVPPGVRVGPIDDDPEVMKGSLEESSSDDSVVEKGNVIYGPWDGSDRPDVQADEVTDD